MLLRQLYCVNVCGSGHVLSSLWSAGGATSKAIVALLSSLPFGIAAVVIILNAQHSKATGAANLLGAAGNVNLRLHS